MARLLIILFLAVSALAQTPTRWRWRSPLPTGEPVSAVAFWNDRFLAATGSGDLFESTNGLDWKFRARIEPNVNSIAVSSNTIVVAAGSIALRSTNLTNWEITYSSEYGISRVHYSQTDHRFVLITARGSGAHSPDGLVWTPLAEVGSYSQTRYSSISEKGVTLLSGDNGSLAIDAAGIVHSIPDFYTYAFIDNRFVAQNFTNTYQSETGLTWTISTNVPISTFINTGDRLIGYADNKLWTTTNGLTWASLPAPGAQSQFSPNTFAYGNGIFIGAFIRPPMPVYTFTSPNIYYSRDAIDWINIIRYNPPNRVFGFIARDADTLYLTSGTNIVQTKDLKTFAIAANFPAEIDPTLDNFDTQPIGLARHGSSLLLATRRKIFSKTGDAGWIQYQVPGFNELFSVAAGNGYVAVTGEPAGNTGVKVTSDFATWSNAALPPNTNYFKYYVNFDDGDFALSIFEYYGAIDGSYYLKKFGLSKNAVAWSIKDLPDGLAATHFLCKMDGQLAFDYHQSGPFVPEASSTLELRNANLDIVNSEYTPIILISGSSWKNSVVMLGAANEIIQSEIKIRLALATNFRLTLDGLDAATRVRIESAESLDPPQTAWAPWANATADELKDLPLPQSSATRFFRAFLPE